MRINERFGETFRYEVSYRFRSASTWVYGGFLFLLAFYIVHVDNGGSHTITGNAPFRVAEITALFCGLFGMLVTAGLFSDAALRDRASQMDALVFTTRLRPAEYLGGRFLAALLVNAVLLLATPLGLWSGSLMPYLQREGFGPNHLSTYLQPVLLFSLPNLVLIGAILFTIAVLSRRAVAVWLGAIGIFVAYLFAAGLWSGISNPFLSVLADPLGINALKGMTRYWTASERNVRSIGFPTMLLWNRVLWMSIAGGLIALLQRRFRFTERFGRVSAETRQEEADLSPPRSFEMTAPQAGVFTRRTRVLQTLAVTREALTDVVAGRTFQVAFVAAVALVVLLGWNVGETLYDTNTWPVTHLVAAVVVGERAILIPWLVIVLFAGELVWKDRESGAAEIADAAPVRTGTMLFGRFLGLVTLIALLQVALMLGGILLQTLHGYYKFEPMLYVKIVFGMQLVEFVILAALAMTVHVLVNQKYVGHLLMIIVIVFFRSASFHGLLVYNSAPAWTYSEMNGFGPFVTPFIAFKFYWASWALLLGVVAFLFWPRGPELSVRGRLAAARARFNGAVVRMTACAVVLIVTSGCFIFYNTNILNEYLSPGRAGEPQAEYERRYGRYADLAQPTMAAADLRVELYPEKTAVDMTGSWRLINKSSSAIRTVHIVTPHSRGYEVRSMSFDRPAKPQLVDAAHGYRIFELERPLAAGESLRFRFDVSYRPRGFANDGPQTKIVRNGSYFDRMLLPFVGYQPFEVTDAKERKVLGLPPKPGMPEPGDANAGRYWSSLRTGDRIPVETIVGTTSDQTVVVPGVLRRSWIENGRRYFHYGDRQPEMFAASIFSAKYAVDARRWKDVVLQVFHHPAHNDTVKRMLDGMSSALDYYSSVFGPYPYRELRIVELTPYSGINGRAFPSALALGEQNFITRGGNGRLDLTFFGTAHETAHQWWGGQVRPAYAKGRSFVSEGVANYCAMMVTEKVLGPAEARRVYDYQMNRYLSQRAEFGRDVPLLQADSDYPYVSYGKGAVALYTLREQIGAEAVNGALRRVVQKFGRTGPPYATSLDVYAELRAVTPPSLQTLLTDLFETITLWDLKTQSATARRMPGGNYEVTLRIAAQKLRADTVGRETPTPMNDAIEIAVFAEGKDAPVYLAKHRIRSGEQTVKVIVAQRPIRAGVDPEGKLIERERGDNIVNVEVTR